MSYLDDREKEEAIVPLNLGALAKKAPKEPMISPEALATAKERGFGRDVQPPAKPKAPNEGVTPGPVNKTSASTAAAGEEGRAAKARHQISRRRRNSGRDTGQLTLTGDKETLESLVTWAVYERLPYVAFVGRLLEMYEREHGPLPDDFKALENDQ